MPSRANSLILRAAGHAFIAITAECFMKPRSGPDFTSFFEDGFMAAIGPLRLSAVLQLLQERRCLPDVSIGSEPNANSAGTFLGRVGEEREGKGREGVREQGSNKQKKELLEC